jgi:hypothetical protein
MHQLTVKPMTGSPVTVQAEIGDTIGEIKKRIELKTGMPAAQQRLIYAGRDMADETLLAMYHLHNETVVHLILRASSCPTPAAAPATGAPPAPTNPAGDTSSAQAARRLAFVSRFEELAQQCQVGREDLEHVAALAVATDTRRALGDDEVVDMILSLSHRRLA